MAGKSNVPYQVRLPGWLSGEEPTCSARDAGDAGSIPGWGRPPAGGNGKPLQYYCPENPMDRRAWWAAVHGVSESGMTEHTAAAAARATGLSPRWMMTDEKFPVLGWLRSWLSNFKCFQLCTSLKFPSVKSATCNRLCVVMACDLKVEDLGSWERKVVGNRSAGIGSLRWEWHRQSKGTKSVIS